MAIDAIAAQPITNRQLVNYIRPGESGADQASLRSLLAAAGFPAAEGADALTSQVRRFQQAETAAGRPFVHGADGKAGPETLAGFAGSSRATSSRRRSRPAWRTTKPSASSPPRKPSLALRRLSRSPRHRGPARPASPPARVRSLAEIAPRARPWIRPWPSARPPSASP